MRPLRVASVKGLPASLPAGERVLWQGAPRWQALALRALHVRKVAIYFAVLLVWYAASMLSGGEPAGEVAVGTLRLAGLACVPVVLLTAYAWMAARGTIYTVTNRRVVMSIGVAMPITFNLPFARIEGANLKLAADGSGDIALALMPGERLAYLVLWPHARPWRFARSQPTLRAIPDAAAVAQTLGRAFAAHADMPVQAAPQPRPDAQVAPVGGRATAAA